MKIEFVDPFVKAGYSVMESLIGEAPERGPLAMRATTFTSQQVTIMTGVSGQVEGSVLFGMSIVTAQKIAAAMIGQPIVQMDDLAWSAISEMGNIITGNAAQLLYEAGYQCDITPPSVIRGVNIEVSTHVPALVVPFTMKFGRLEINVALSETAASRAA
jgi:chemotaxis protein CheX